MSITSIDSVVTETQLEAEVGGATKLRSLIDQTEWADARHARQSALNQVVSRLANRVPPVREADLIDVSQLATVVMYGALSRLYVNASVSTEDSFWAKHKYWQRMYETELQALNPTVGDGLKAGPTSITIHRR